MPGGKVAPVAVSADAEPRPDEGPAKKHIVDKDGSQTDPSTGKLMKASDLCPAWNSAKGCAAKQKDCSNKKLLHRCSAHVATGFRGAWNRSAQKHK